MQTGFQTIAVTGLAVLLMQIDAQASNHPYQPVAISVEHGLQALAVTLYKNESGWAVTLISLSMTP